MKLPPKSSDILFNSKNSIINERNKLLSSITLEQTKNLYNTIENIIDNLDNESINELLQSTNEADIDKFFNILVEETHNIIHTKNPSIKAIKASTFGYMEKFTKQLDFILKKLSFNYFLATVFTDFEIQWFHLEWGNLIQLYKKVCFIAARGHSKSYTFSHIYPIWRMFQFGSEVIEHSREYSLYRRGMLITNEYGLAKHLLSIIKETIEENPFLREQLLPISRETWSKEEIICKNGAKFTVKSFGSKMRGFHPGYIVVDDFLSDNIIWSKDQRDKYWQIFSGVILNLLLPKGQIVVVGTPFIEGDLYGKLKEDKTFKVFEYPAIYPDGSLLWESHFDWNSLMATRETLGQVTFSREYLVKPISEESTVFPWEIIKKAFVGMEEYTLVENTYSFPKKFDKVVIGTDFAISSSVGADASVFIVIGVIGEEFWILNIFREKGMSYDKQIAKIKQLNANFYPQIIAIETNQMQKIFYQMAQDAGLPVIEHNTGTDKYSFTEGLPAMAVLFEQGRIKIPRGDQRSVDITDLLGMELASYTFDENKNKIVSVKGHGDISMALWQGIRAAKYAGNGFTFSFI